MKKILLTVIALILCVFIVACDSDSEKRRSDDDYDEEEAGAVATTAGSSNNNPNGAHKDGDIAEVYKLYPGLEQIGTFNNGLAPFVVRDNEGQKYGYIDINGKVIVEPKYFTGRNYVNIYNVPSFEENNCISVSDSEKTNGYEIVVTKILDKSGNALFEVGKDGVSELGNVSNGYFAVETQKEEFTGYVYTVTYYSAKDATKIVEFNNSSIYYNTDIGIDGSANVYDNQRGTIRFNISSYDPDFKTKADSWSVDVKNIESFQGVNCYYKVSSENNTLGQIATVVLINKDNIYYYATVDQNGNVLMAPQKNISFGFDGYYSVSENCTFYNDLCPAKDEATGLWGYINPQGEWMIQPQYTDAMPFGMDGYATVDYTTVIDDKGNIVLAPESIGLSDVVGTYTKGSYELILFEDGEVKYMIRSSYSTTTYTGTFELQGGKLVISGIGYCIDWGINPSGSDQDGAHTLQKDGDDLIINGERWTKSK